MEKFGKAYKLCSRKAIGELFKEGRQLRSYPFVVYYKFMELDTPAPFQVVISAPKRNFKRAHDRNYLKRLMRETLRKNKQELEQVLELKTNKLALFIIYNQRDLPDYESVEKGMGKLLSKLASSLNS